MKPEQITAWALDEASAEERQQLEAALLENPADKQKAEETKAFCDFLLSELRDESLALTDLQRERLVAQASGAPAARAPSINGAPVPRPASRPAQTKWRIGVIVRLSLAACAVLGGFWTWQAYTTKQHEARAVASVASVAGKPAVKVQLAPKPETKRKAGPESRLLADNQTVKAAVAQEQPKGKLPPPAPSPPLRQLPTRWP